MRDDLLQTLALCAAFWTAVFVFARRGGSECPRRFVLGLGLGALLAHLGGALLYGRAASLRAGVLLDPALGASVLFVPLGPCLLRCSTAAFASLPLACAVARLGCLARGCCHGPAGEPTPLAEIAGLVLLHSGAARLPERWVAPAVLAGFGLVRLLAEPWRALPASGAPAVSASALAATWVAVGGAMAAYSARTDGGSSKTAARWPAASLRCRTRTAKRSGSRNSSYSPKYISSSTTKRAPRRRR